MPAHDGLWPDDRYGVKDARKAAIKPNKTGPDRPKSNTADVAHIAEASSADAAGPESRLQAAVLKQSHSAWTKRKASVIINRNHVLIWQQPPLGG
jgi:hypothetical protein